MPTFSAPDQDFHALSLKDLLEARDHYHVHLMDKENVVATAVGRYLIRKTDPWPEMKRGLNLVMPPKRKEKGERTLENSEVRPYSWPCVLAFVRDWILEHDFTSVEKIAQTMVPKTLYLPDGRKVPVCVVCAPTSTRSGAAVEDLVFPKQRVMGGGYPVLATVQGEQHVASVGCLVTDGHLVYALTNRHVSGAAGEKLFTRLGGEETEIGRSSARQLTKLQFREVYPGWPGEDVYVNLDIGLIELLDKSLWTTQVYGLGSLGDLADFSTHNLSLRLVGQPVSAFGCVSRLMRGEIRALLYRYKALNGSEYVADFLIGPRRSSGDDLPFATRRGDSGTLWVLEERDADASVEAEADGRRRARLRPLAVQWGGQTLGKSSFALATCLSTVCRHLDVEVVRDWNSGFVEYWGAVGHYGIAAMAIDRMVNPNLKAAMAANRRRVTYDLAEVKPSTFAGLSKRSFVPLADVADYVWAAGKSLRKNTDPNNHFADVDLEGPRDHKTLLQQFGDDPGGTMKVKVWKDYYKHVNANLPDAWPRKIDKGLLPFRIGQIYRAMVDSARAGNGAEFVCAAGILSHYVGDAANPLHISYLHHGDPEDLVTNQEGKKEPRAKQIHTDYEANLLAKRGREIWDRVETRLAGLAPWGAIKGGPGAATAAMKLMQHTCQALAPRTLVDAYTPVVDEDAATRMAALWEVAKDGTVEAIAAACQLWTALCDGAWTEGDGDANLGGLGEVDEDTLAALYTDPQFLPSVSLDAIEAEL